MIPENAIVVAGHICVDLIPGMTVPTASLGELLRPGTLVNVGPVVVSTGGAVANTGLALHKLGYPVRLAGKVGGDAFGRVILEALRAHGSALADAMSVDPGAATSYTMVLSPPGIDRVFLHHPGANDTFGPADLSPRQLAGASIFHFGYPPLMKGLFADGGHRMADILKAARAAGALTSLDMAMPDPLSDSGRVDWRAWLAVVLPHVDVFVPSFDELRFMLGGPGASPSREAVRRLGRQVLDLGAGAAAIKLGAAGLWLGTASRLGWGSADLASAWQGRELLATCCRAEVAGTTGAGDCTIAGLLAALFDGLGPAEALAFATAVGACSVEQSDATSAVPPADAVRARLAAGWRRHPPDPALGSWKPTDTPGVFAP